MDLHDGYSRGVAHGFIDVTCGINMPSHGYLAFNLWPSLLARFSTANVVMAKASI